MAEHPDAAHLATDATGLNPRAAAAAILPSSLAGEQRYLTPTAPGPPSREGSGLLRTLSREPSLVASPRGEDSSADLVEGKVLRLIARICRAAKITDLEQEGSEVLEASASLKDLSPENSTGVLD